MRIRLAFTATAIALTLVFSQSITLRAAEPIKPAAHALPDDPKAIVISYDYTGGMIRRLVPGPLLTVSRDGTVQSSDPLERGKEFKITLTADQLQALLHEIMDVRGFAKMKDDDLKPKPNPGGPMMVVSDGVTSKITVNIPEINNTLSGYALQKDPAGAVDSPGNRFVAIRERLEQLRNLTLVGGTEAFNKLVDAAAAQEKKDQPKEPLIEASDLQYVRIDPGYVTVAQFARKVSEPHGWHMVFAFVKRDAEGKIEVKVEVGGSVVEK